MKISKERQAFFESLTTESVLEVFRSSDISETEKTIKSLATLTKEELHYLDLRNVFAQEVFSLESVLQGILKMENTSGAKKVLEVFLCEFPDWQQDFRFNAKNPIFESLRQGKLELFDVFIKKTPATKVSIYGPPGDNKKNPLDAAMECKLAPDIQEDVLNRVLSLQEQSNQELEFRLMQAVQYGNLGAVKALIKRGVEHGFKTSYGETALAIACIKDKSQTSDEILAWCLRAENMSLAINDGWGDEPCSPMHNAAKRGRVAALEMLFEKGAFFDHPRMKNSVTPLMTASANASLETVKWLLNKGASHLANDKKGNNALHWIVLDGLTSLQEEKYAVPCALLLLKAGVPLGKNKDGKTPLDLARRSTCPHLSALFSEHELKNTLKDSLEENKDPLVRPKKSL